MESGSRNARLRLKTHSFAPARARRLLGCTQLLDQGFAELSLVDRLGPSGEAYVQVLPSLDLQPAAGHLDRHGAVGAPQDRCHRRSGPARARGHRLTHAALEDARVYLGVAGAVPKRHVGAVGKQSVALDLPAVAP